MKSLYLIAHQALLVLIYVHLVNGRAAAEEVNVAIGCPATSTSLYQNLTQYGPAAVTDGVSNGDFNAAPMFCTAKGPYESVEVSLGIAYRVSSIEIWNRTDNPTARARMNHCRILAAVPHEVTPGNWGWKWIVYASWADFGSSASRRFVNTNFPHRVMKVMVQRNNSNDYLHFAELRVNTEVGANVSFTSEVGSKTPRMTAYEEINVAPMAAAMASSKLAGKEASMVTDGLRGGDWSYGGVFCTQLQKLPQIQLKLAFPVDLKAVQIWNRTDAGLPQIPRRISYGTVFVKRSSGDPTYTQIGTWGLTEAELLRVNEVSPDIGQVSEVWVRLHSLGQYLHVSEIEVLENDAHLGVIDAATEQTLKNLRIEAAGKMQWTLERWDREFGSRYPFQRLHPVRKQAILKRMKENPGIFRKFYKANHSKDEVHLAVLVSGDNTSDGQLEWRYRIMPVNHHDRRLSVLISTQLARSYGDAISEEEIVALSEMAKNSSFPVLEDEDLGIDQGSMTSSQFEAHVESYINQAKSRKVYARGLFIATPYQVPAESVQAWQDGIEAAWDALEDFSMNALEDAIREAESLELDDEADALAAFDREIREFIEVLDRLRIGADTNGIADLQPAIDQINHYIQFFRDIQTNNPTTRAEGTTASQGLIAFNTALASLNAAQDVYTTNLNAAINRAAYIEQKHRHFFHDFSPL